MAFFSNSRDQLVDDLNAEVAALRKEVSSLRRSAGKRGAQLYNEANASASRVYDDLSTLAADYAPRIRESARDLERRARENPAATAAVGVAAIAFLAMLLARRSE